MTVEIFTGAAAQANAAAMPANILLYSDPGMGKSTDAVAAFCSDGACRAFVVQCEDNAIKAPVSRGLPTPEHSGTIKTWEDMYQACAFVQHYKSRYSALIVDGFSIFSSNLYKQAQETIGKSAKNKFDVPVFVRTKLIEFRGWLRDIGLHSVLIAHSVQPAMQDGIFYPGGFSVTPKSLIGDYYSQTDTVLRVGYVYPTAPTTPPMPGAPLPEPTRVYFTGGQAWPEQFAQPHDWRFWRTKNREGCNSAVVPADLGAFLRAKQPPYGGL